MAHIMVNACKKIMVLVLATSFATTPVKPISETTANIGSAIGGVAVGALSGGYCWYTLHQNHDLRTSPEYLFLVSALVAAGCGGITWYILYQILHGYTPQGRINAARAIINNIANDALVKGSRGASDEIIKKATLICGSSYPLVLAREKLVAFVHSLGAAQELLTLADNDIRSDISLSHLGKQSERLNIKISELSQTIEAYLEIITQHADYRFQVNYYEKHLEAERQRAHEKALSDQRLSHESWEKNMDRWHDTSEKDKDRELKQNIVNQTQNRPTTVNINI
jgi:hypothetical protein